MATKIKLAKEKAWQELLLQVEKDVWGKPYKVVMRRLHKKRHISGIETPGRLESIINELFPSPNHQPRVAPLPTNLEPINSFTEDEIRCAVNELRNGKVPGPDQIPNEALKIAVNCDSKRFQKILNRCIEDGIFPTIWKTGQFVFFPKPNKPLENPSSYRPTCLLDTCGKLLEKLLSKGLEIV